MNTLDVQHPVGGTMTVWRVEYTWHAGYRGCPPSHYHGATPDEPPHAEVWSATLIHLGDREVSAHHRYSENRYLYYHTPPNRRDSEAERLWDAIEEMFAEDVIASERVLSEIEECHGASV
jgi:hypothetical protein